MKSQFLRLLFCLACWLGLAACLNAESGWRAETNEHVAGFATVFNGYTRTRLPDHTFKPEFYVFGEGGKISRPINDPTLDQLDFQHVAQAIAPQLAAQNYRPALKSADAQLLILVFWGSTHGSQDAGDPSQATDVLAAASATASRTAGEASRLAAAAANNPGLSGEAQAAATLNRVAQEERETALWQLSIANQARDDLDARNARILGYSDALDRARFFRHQSFASDVIGEIGANRYYVVLQAYDFATARQHKKLKPLWTARLSMYESGTFDQALVNMLAKGRHLFGQDSHGLRRDVVPDGKVELGETVVVPDK